MTQGSRARIAVLGGTFDPPHVGHLIVAQEIYESLEVDLLLVIPAANPPHRDTTLPAEVRFGLVEAAFRGDPRMEVSPLELAREGPSYTADTLEWIQEHQDPEEVFLVIGADQLASFGQWHRPDDIVEMATLVAIPRGDREVPPPGESAGYPYRRIEVTRIDVSGTLIRERLRTGRSVRYLVPERIRGDLMDAWRRRGG